MFKSLSISIGTAVAEERLKEIKAAFSENGFDVDVRVEEKIQLSDGATGAFNVTVQVVLGFLIVEFAKHFLKDAYDRLKASVIQMAKRLKEARTDRCAIGIEFYGEDVIVTCQIPANGENLIQMAMEDLERELKTRGCRFTDSIERRIWFSNEVVGWVSRSDWERWQGLRKIEIDRDALRDKLRFIDESVRSIEKDVRVQIAALLAPVASVAIFLFKPELAIQSFRMLGHCWILMKDGLQATTLAPSVDNVDLVFSICIIGTGVTYCFFWMINLFLQSRGYLFRQLQNAAKRLECCLGINFCLPSSWSTSWENNKSKLEPSHGYCSIKRTFVWFGRLELYAFLPESLRVYRVVSLVVETLVYWVLAGFAGTVFFSTNFSSGKLVLSIMVPLVIWILSILQGWLAIRIYQEKFRRLSN